MLALMAQEAGVPELLPGQTPQVGRVLEFSVSGVPQTGNPFDPEALRVDAAFRLPSGQTRAVPGFWFQDYSRRLGSGREILSAVKDPEWRLRFLPTEAGEHRVRVTVVTNGQPAGTSAERVFVVAAAAPPSARAGAVRRAANGRYFEAPDGRPLPLVGANFCWHGGRGTFDYSAWFSNLGRAGGNFARVWMSPWALGIEAESGTGLNYRLDRAWQLDSVFQLAETHGLYVLLCLDYHGMFETQPDYWGGNDNWKINPYNAANGGPCATQNEFFTRPEARAMYQKRLRYLIARYAAFPSLLAWQFFNEIDNVYRHLRPDDVVAWHADMADWLRAHDPWGHLITTSLTGGSDRPELWRLPQMDFTVYHSYNLAHPAAALPGLTQRLARDYAKPVMIGEYGTDWRGWRREQDPYLRGWRQGLWAGALGGSVGTAMSWWWEEIHAAKLYTHYTALRGILEPGGWGAGVWEPLVFETAGPPPETVGDPLPGGQPFTITLPLDTGWGAKPRGQLAVPNPDAAGLAAGALNSFVHGTAHPDLRTPFRLDAWFTNDARLVMRLNSVSDGAVLSVLVNGQQVLRRALPNKDGQWLVNHEYDEDIPVDLPAGRALVEIRNAGGDWFYLDWVRLENVLPARYAGDWQPDPMAAGLRQDRRALLYVVSPRASYPANATNEVLEPWRGGALKLTGLPAGNYRARWFDPPTGEPRGETRGASDGQRLALPLPDFSEDLAGRLEPVNEFSLHLPKREPDGSFSARHQGETGRRYALEASPDLAAWEELGEFIQAAPEEPVRDAAPVADHRFYRTRLRE